MLMGIFLFFPQSGRGQSPDVAVIEEAGFNRNDAVASTMAYLMKRQVVMTLLCSAMPAGHWLMRLMKFSDVYSIHHTMVCEQCAGHTETCVHKFYLRPGHIDLTPGKKGLVERVMEMLVEGFYQREVMGHSGSEGAGKQMVFPPNLIAQVAKHRRVDLTEEVLATVQTIAVVIDPVQAASKTSGIGLCILLKTTQQIFYVSISFSSSSHVQSTPPTTIFCEMVCSRASRRRSSSSIASVSYHVRSGGTMPPVQAMNVIVKTHSWIGEKANVGGVLFARVQVRVSITDRVRGCALSKGNTRHESKQSHITHIVPRSDCSSGEHHRASTKASISRGFPASQQSTDKASIQGVAMCDGTGEGIFGGASNSIV